jgi:hypothetical protein
MARRVGPGGSGVSSNHSAAEASRRAAEAARRAAEAARLAAEAQRRAQEQAQPQAQRQAQAPQQVERALSTAVNRVANAVERTAGPRAPVTLEAPRPGEGTHSTARAYSLNELRAIEAASQRTNYDVAGANAHLSRFSFSQEAPQGSTAATAIAANAITGRAATGVDGDLNCVEGAVEGQDYFASRGVQTEIVVAEEHAVLRMPDGRYYDPTAQALVPPSEVDRYDGVDGITVAERQHLEREARTAADRLGPTATAQERQAAATRAVEREAGAAGIDEPSALTAANEVAAADTTEAQLDADIAELQAAAGENPAAGAALLEEKLADAPPEYQDQLIQRAQPVIEQIGAGVAAEYDYGTVQSTVDSLSRASEHLSPEAQARLGASFTTGIVEAGGERNLTNSMVGSALVQTMGNGNGAAFSLSIAQAARAQGLSNAADIEMHVLGGTSSIHAQFRDAQARVDQLNSELYTYLESYGPYLSDEQKSRAIEAWQADHAEEYGEWERLGGQTVTLVENADRTLQDPNASPLAREFATATMEQDMVWLSQTRAGQRMLADAVAAEGAAAPGSEVHTLLDTISTVAAGMGEQEGRTYGETLGLQALRATGSALVEGEGASGARQDALIAGMSQLEPLIGLPEGHLESVGQDFKALSEIDPASPDALGATRTILDTIDKKLATLGADGTSGRAGQMLRGIGLAVSVAQLGQAWSGFSDAAVADQVATLASSVQLGADGAVWAMELLGKSAPALQRVSAVAGGILVAVDLYKGVDALNNGNTTGAVGHGFLAMGGALMTAGAVSSSVPVAGWVAGAAMIIGGGILVAVGQNNMAREDREKFLASAGVPEEIIPVLSDDPGRVEELAGMGFTTEQLLDLAGRAPSLFTRGDNEGGPIQGLQALQQQYGLSGPEVYGLLRTILDSGVEHPDSAVHFLVKSSGGIAQGGDMPTTHEGWIERYESLQAGLDPERNEEQYAAVQATLEFLEARG